MEDIITDSVADPLLLTNWLPQGLHPAYHLPGLYLGCVAEAVEAWHEQLGADVLCLFPEAHVRRSAYPTLRDS